MGGREVGGSTLLKLRETETKRDYILFAMTYRKSWVIKPSGFIGKCLTRESICCIFLFLFYSVVVSAAGIFALFCCFC